MSRLAVSALLAVAFTAGALAALLAPGVARADTVTSHNWSGYAVHRSGLHFRSVRASWREPAGVCNAGASTAAAFWVGLGGYSLRSQALEQIGSELDCSSGGRASISAWYELVPAPTRTLRMTIAAGDLLTASVEVAGHRVSLKLADQTRHERFSKTITDHRLDTSSAEWIAEDPSDCASSSSCTALTLTDFGAVRFSGASATTTAGRSAAVTSGLWTTTRILLGYVKQGTAFIARSGTAGAAPKLLSGSSFQVAYSGSAASSGASSGGSSGGGAGGGGAGGGPGRGGGGGGPGGSGGPGGGGPGGESGGTRR